MQGASARKVVFDPRPILGVLVRHEVRFVAIGGIAASLQGSTTITNDFDICYARDQENLERLTAALKEYGVTLQKEPTPADAVVLAVAHESYRTAGWPLITRLLANGRGLVMDVKGVLDPRAKPADVEIWRL